jgi:hypothetical protein
MDNILDEPISAEDVKEALKADLLPANWYNLADLKFEGRTVEAGKTNAGRPYFHFTGTVASNGDGQTDGLAGRKMFFNASPVKVINAQGRPDYMYQMWAKIVSAIGGAATPREAFEKLPQTPIAAKVTLRPRRDDPETPENLVVAFRAVVS